MFTTEFLACQPGGFKPRFRHPRRCRSCRCAKGSNKTWASSIRAFSGSRMGRHNILTPKAFDPRHQRRLAVFSSTLCSCSAATPSLPCQSKEPTYARHIKPPGIYAARYSHRTWPLGHWPRLCARQTGNPTQPLCHTPSRFHWVSGFPDSGRQSIAGHGDPRRSSPDKGRCGGGVHRG